MKKGEVKQNRFRSYPKAQSIGRPKGISVTLDLKNPFKQTKHNRSTSSFHTTLEKSFNQLDRSIGVGSSINRFQTVEQSVIAGE